MLHWKRPLADRVLPAASSLLLGVSQPCSICGQRVGPAASSGTPMRDPDCPLLDPVLRSLRQLLCARCMAGVPWIGEVRCTACGRAVDCPDCVRRTEPKLIMNRSAVRYSGDMKEWLSAYKYQGHERMLQILSLMLDYAYQQLVRSIPSGQQLVRPLVTSVPISDVRMLERGFNQAERLAESLAARHRLPYIRLLRRTRHTNRQSHKSRHERIKDLQGAFDVIREALPAEGALPDAIVIIDDVYTTGSTLHECARAIHAATKLPIYSLTWAR